METWKQANTTTDYGKRILDLGAEAILACEPRDVSLLYLLFYIASAKTLENLISTPQGYQESRFVGGSQQVSVKLAKRLGRSVVLRSPVRRIVQHSKDVLVESDRLAVTVKAPKTTHEVSIRQLENWASSTAKSSHDTLLKVRVHEELAADLTPYVPAPAV